MSKTKVNGIILNGILYRLVEKKSDCQCSECSVYAECIDPTSQCYLCNLFGKDETTHHFEAFGEVFQVKQKSHEED